MCRSVTGGCAFKMMCRARGVGGGEGKKVVEGKKKKVKAMHTAISANATWGRYIHGGVGKWGGLFLAYHNPQAKQLDRYLW